MAALGALVWELAPELVLDGLEEEAVRSSVHILSFRLNRWDHRKYILLLRVMVLLLADVVAEVVDGAAVEEGVVLVVRVVDATVVESAVVEAPVVVAAVAEVEAPVADAVAPPRSWN